MSEVKNDLIERIGHDILTYLCENTDQRYDEVFFALTSDIVKELGLRYILPDIDNLVGVAVCGIKKDYESSYITLYIDLGINSDGVSIDLGRAYATLFVSGIDITPYVYNLVNLFKIIEKNPKQANQVIKIKRKKKVKCKT